MSQGRNSFIVVLAFILVACMSGMSGARSFNDKATLSLTSTKIQVGRPVGLDFQGSFLPATATVHFFVGSDTANGTTQVTIGGMTLTIPVADAVDVGTAAPTTGTAHLDYTVPQTPSLVGTQMRVIGVCVINGMAIISNFATSGPILGDDIS